MSRDEDTPPAGPSQGDGHADAETPPRGAEGEVRDPLAWRLQRILVALDASPASAAAAATAARLAALLETELAGLFVEDAELARLGELPAALEVGSYSASPRPHAPGDVERRLRAQAQRARRIFESTAARVSVRTSFRVVRGSVSREVVLAADAGELLSLGRVGTSCLSRLGSVARAALTEGRGPLLLLPPGGHLGPPVVVAFTDTAQGYRALAAAARLPGRGRSAAPRGRAGRRVPDDDLVVLLPPADDTETARLRQAALTALAPVGRHPRFRRAAGREPHALLHAVAAERAHALVLPGHSPLASTDEVEGVVERLSCAVLLVR